MGSTSLRRAAPAFVAASLSWLLVAPAYADDQPVLDNIPPEHFDYIKAYNRDVEESKGVLPREVKWKSGTKIRVAFPPNGDESNYQLIEDTALEWIKEGKHRGGEFKLTIDLAFRDSTGKRFTWTPQDKFSGETPQVRVAFGGAGYNSLMGTINLRVPASKHTMNLEGFDRLTAEDRAKWETSGKKYLVLHEFGHVFGFAHEQFHSKCQDRGDASDPGNTRAFVWEKDPGYVEDTKKNPNFQIFKDSKKIRLLKDGTEEACKKRYLGRDKERRSPGIYLQYSELPNCWNPEQISFNFDSDVFYKSLANTIKPLETDLPDKNSVMLYVIDEHLFAAGKNGACYTGTFAKGLSNQDVSMMRRVYGGD